MKPCAKNRKLIAWLAVNALAAEPAKLLRDHLAQCAGCRGYWDELSNVTSKMTVAPPAADLEATESFHRRVAAKLQALESQSGLEKLATWFRGALLNWRLAAPAFAAVVIMFFALLTPSHPPTTSGSAPSVHEVSSSGAGNDLSPTLANYQRIAGQSLDKLDELLTRQGNKRLPSVPALDLATASF